MWVPEPNSVNLIILLKLVLILRAPCVSIDFGQVSVDRPHLSNTQTSPVSLTCGPHMSGLTLGDSVDLLTS